MKEAKKVLFVCLGNICRSPIGEAVFNHKSADLDMKADSAGTAAYHVGEQPDHRSIEVARQHGIPMYHKARKFIAEDFDRFDYILAMDRQNYEDMKRLVAGDPTNLYLLRSFDPNANGNMDVPDPYYGGYDGFEKVYQMVDRSIDELIKHIASVQ